MQVLVVGGLDAAYARLCAALYLVARSLQCRGRDLAFFDPRFPDSMQAVGTTHPAVVGTGVAKAVRLGVVY